MHHTTQEILKGYYDGIRQKDGWQAFVSDDILFAGTGVKATRGKQAYVEGTAQFLRTVTDAQVKETIEAGGKACNLVHYDFTTPKGNRASFDVAEIMTIEEGKIVSSTIFFDTLAFGKFMAQG